MVYLVGFGFRVSRFWFLVVSTAKACLPIRNQKHETRNRTNESIKIHSFVLKQSVGVLIIPL